MGTIVYHGAIHSKRRQTSKEKYVADATAQCE